jgi:hypothetical protein
MTKSVLMNTKGPLNLHLRPMRKPHCPKTLEMLSESQFCRSAHRSIEIGNNYASTKPLSDLNP